MRGKLVHVGCGGVIGSVISVYPLIRDVARELIEDQLNDSYPYECKKCLNRFSQSEIDSYYEHKKQEVKIGTD